jgi:hypothetical protein
MTNLHDHTPGGELIFAGEMEGVQFRLLSLELHNDDDDDKPDVPEGDVHGNWLHVETDEAGEAYLSAPGELVEELQRLEAETGDVFEVTRCVKSGPAQTDPYEVNVEALEAEQGRL